MNRQEFYEESEDIIQAMSQKISKLSGIDLTEVMSEANLIFCECLEKYQPEKADFKNFLTTSLYFKLYKFCRKRDRQLIELDHDIERISYEHDNLIDTTLESLSRDSKMVIDHVFTLAPDFAERRKKLKRGSVKRHLKSQGWKNKRIDIAFQEISMALQ